MPNGNTENLSSGNGHSTAAEAIYALSDEQILEIEDSAAPSDASVSAPLSQADELDAFAANISGRDGHSASNDSGSSAPAGDEPLARRDVLASDSSASPQRSNQRASDTAAQSQSSNANAGAPPAWLAEAIADPQRGKEARAFWERAQSAERDSAAYRATFATPGDAREAATRAGQLSSIDRAYYGTEGVAPHELSASREALAQQLFRDDPAVFRDMLAAGLRAAGNASGRDCFLYR